jgi:hypothetical protein
MLSNLFLYSTANSLEEWSDSASETCRACSGNWPANALGDQGCGQEVAGKTTPYYAVTRCAMRDSKFACILEPKKKSPKPIAVRIALCVDVGSSQLSGGSVAPLGGSARVRRKWWSPRRRGWEVWVLDMDLHWGWRLLPLPRHPGHLLQKRRESLTAGFSHRSALQPVTRSPTRPALQAAAPLEHRILSPPPPRVPHPMESPCRHLPVSSMRSSPALLIFLPAQWETAIPRQVSNQGLAPLSLAKSQSAYFARLRVLALD